jgi:hypothetical protein
MSHVLLVCLLGPSSSSYCVGLTHGQATGVYVGVCAAACRCVSVRVCRLLSLLCCALHFLPKRVPRSEIYLGKIMG